MDKEKLRQATQEFGWTFIAFFGAGFLLWITGWTALPNLEATESAVRAALVSAAGGAAKAALWYFTGKKVVRG